MLVLDDTLPNKMYYKEFKIQVVSQKKLILFWKTLHSVSVGIIIKSKKKKK